MFELEHESSGNKYLVGNSLDKILVSKISLVRKSKTIFNQFTIR